MQNAMLDLDSQLREFLGRVSQKTRPKLFYGQGA
jgi:hypothetical protein